MAKYRPNDRALCNDSPAHASAFVDADDSAPICPLRRNHAKTKCDDLPLRSGLRMRSRLYLPFLRLPNDSGLLTMNGEERQESRSSSTATPEGALNPLLHLRRKFLAFVQRRVGDPASAEDILQSAYMRALKAEGELRESDSSVAWFYRILRNAVIDHYRRRKVEGAALERWAMELETAVQPDAALFNATCQCIHGALGVLRPSYASVLREVDLMGTGLAAYAASQHITRGNAAVRAHRARVALRRQLIRCCGTCAEHGCLECICRASTALQQGAAERDCD